MDKSQKSKKNMLVKLLAYLLTSANAAMYSSLASFVLLVTKIGEDNDTWNGYNTTEANRTTGITQDQIDAKHLMANEWAMVAKAAFSYAISINDHTLAEQWHVSNSQIFQLNNTEAAAQCDNLMISIGPYISLLADFGITAPVLIDADNTTTAFESYLGTAKSGESTKSAAGTAIDTLIHDNITPRLIQMDALVDSIYFKNKQDFKNGYLAVRVLDGLPTHHTQLEVQFYILGTTTPIIGAQIKEMVTGKAGIADNVGIAHIIEFKGGNDLMFEASCANYITQNIVQTVPRSKKVSITIFLKPI
jgi:hypothetical protein